MPIDLRISPKLVQQQAVERLREAILSGVFKPGQRIVESDLCAQMGVSRPSLREALRRLEAEKLVQIIPNKGPIIPFIPWSEAQQIYDVRSLIEGEAASACAANRSSDAITLMKAALSDFATADKIGDAIGRLTHTERFYAVVFRECGNGVLEEIARGLLARINSLRQQSMSQPGRGRKSLVEMRAILNAIEAKKPERARAAAHEHVVSACKAAREVFGKQMTF